MKTESFVRQIDVNGKVLEIVDITLLEKNGIADIQRLPYAIKILVENLLRKLDNEVVLERDLRNIAGWQKHYTEPVEIPHHPARVLMQDFTGVPAVVDLAAMRDAVGKLGGNPGLINPLVPVELVVDHSIQVDYYATPDALEKNVAKEYERNQERYELLKWAQKSFDNFKVVPPNSGICHQVNLEYLGRVVMTEKTKDGWIAYPDTLVGTDSHTTMINSLGILGWGVGGIEAEAVMLGQPYYMSIPEVVGVRMTGRLRPGVTATDLVLRVTEVLREKRVVEKFVEFFGRGMQGLTLTDRATIANMSPEYGATMGFFPIDEKTVTYLEMTNRAEQAGIVERYARETGLFYDGDQEPEYSDIVDLDLSTIEPSVSGPARPQDRIPVGSLKETFYAICDSDDPAGSPAQESICAKDIPVTLGENEEKIGNGSVVIAAITSCTNTSNPYVMMGAGLLARNAVEKGLKVPAYVKTSLAPGSKVVIDYLTAAGLMPSLEALGFHLAAFGCTTCIGNSGPLDPGIEDVIVRENLTVAAVLSGNRNFEARIHQRIKANFLASPMLVIAYALAGRMDLNVDKDPIGMDSRGEPVLLEDVWPDSTEIEKLVAAHSVPESYKKVYDDIFKGDRFWENLSVTESTTFQWVAGSTYIKNPPYFDKFSLALEKPERLEEGYALLVLGDSVTTDHISPAGAIPEAYPAGQYLSAEGVGPQDFNSYGSRRGNHEVMMRGTFGNIRIKNRLVHPKEGSYTRKFPKGEEMFVFDAAMQYGREGKPLVVLGGKEYGTGSSRDWAAKGTNLLGVQVVIARSFERIHRSNLVGMGVLPLVFAEGESWETLGLDGSETYFVEGIGDMAPRKTLKVRAVKEGVSEVVFKVTTRLDTAVDVAYFEHGGILPYVLRQIISS
jgi:aconitate hydratase